MEKNKRLEILGHIMRKHALIMRKLHRIMWKFKQFIKLIIRPVQLYAYGKLGLEIVTNAVTFVTEFFPFVIKIYGGVGNLRPAFTVEIKGLAVGILPQLLPK